MYAQEVLSCLVSACVKPGNTPEKSIEYDYFLILTMLCHDWGKVAHRAGDTTLVNQKVRMKKAHSTLRRQYYTYRRKKVHYR